MKIILLLCTGLFLANGSVHGMNKFKNLPINTYFEQMVKYSFMPLFKNSKKFYSKDFEDVFKDLKSEKEITDKFWSFRRKLDNNYEKALEKNKLNDLLITTIENGDINTIKERIRYGANINAKSYDPSSSYSDPKKETTPLIFACSHASEMNMPEIIEELLINGANPNLGIEDGSITPIFKAILSNNTKTVRELLKRGAIPRISNFCEAILFNESPEIIKELLGWGMNPNKKFSVYKHTYLHLACKQQRYQACTALIENGARVNIKSKDNSTPLHMVLKGFRKNEPTSSTIAIIKKLIEYNADINAVDEEGLKPLDYAIKIGNIDIIELLQNASKQN